MDNHSFVILYCVAMCNVIFLVVQKQGKKAGDDLNDAENAGDDNK